MSTRETILAAIATALSGVAGGRIYRSRREQLPTLPAVIVQPLSEINREEVLGLTDHLLTVGIAVYAKGDTPDTAADATLAAAWLALSAANALGLGSEVQVMPETEIDWNTEDYDFAQVQLRITVNYRTATGAM